MDLLFDDTDCAAREMYSRVANRIIRELEFRGVPIQGELESSFPDDKNVAKSWFVHRLRGQRPRWNTVKRGRLGIMDLFCGCGGLSFGLKEAAESLGYKPVFECGVDLDRAALDVYRRNLNAGSICLRNVTELVEFDTWESDCRDPSTCGFVGRPQPLNELKQLIGKVDVVVGGPPCQGHSNLNNHTRRADPRNLHYLAMPAVAVALDASVAIVENVPEVVRDKHSVVKKAVALFESNGYHVTDAGPLNAFKCGVAQTRKRHFLIATKYKNPDVMAVINGLVPAELTVWDAIGDLAELSGVLDAFDAPSRLSQENEKRVAWLHDNDARDLPNELRPDCHKNGHTYPSIYGRLDRDKPSPTVTGGFLSPGRGRYVHPSLPRALTPHEGARLQGFPDDFSFVDRDGMELSKKNYSKMIGNAVPPPLAFIVGLAALFNFTR